MGTGAARSVSLVRRRVLEDVVRGLDEVWAGPGVLVAC